MNTTEQQLEMVSAELADAKAEIEVLEALNTMMKRALFKMLSGELPIITANDLMSDAPELIEFVLDGDSVDMRGVA